MKITNSTDLWIDDFPFPQKDGNKYSRGHVAVVAAHSHLMGAAKLASVAALRANAGLVTIICPEELLSLYSSAPFAVMYSTYQAQSEIVGIIENKKISAVLVGPGLDAGDETKEITLRLLDVQIPCVLDAGAISCFADDPEILFSKLRERKSPTILTPHEGEFVKIFGAIEDRFEAVNKAVDITQSIVLLKGSQTIISSREEVIVNPEASPYLATAGSGDVLAGIIVGLLASVNVQDNIMTAIKAASCAVWIHSKCAENLGAGMIADDIINEIPQVLSGII